MRKNLCKFRDSLDYPNFCILKAVKNRLFQYFIQFKNLGIFFIALKSFLMDHSEEIIRENGEKFRMVTSRQ